MWITTVTIGRNVGDKPLGFYDWNDFGVEVVAALTVNLSVKPEQVEIHFGTTEWLGEPEQSAKFSVLTEYHPGHTTVGILKRDLSGIKDRFNQEAIALSVAESELV